MAIDSVLSAQINMMQESLLHCPDHEVLTPDETGWLSVFSNEYGDGKKYLPGLDITLSDPNE